MPFFSQQPHMDIVPASAIASDGFSPAHFLAESGFMEERQGSQIVFRDARSDPEEVHLAEREPQDQVQSIAAVSPLPVGRVANPDLDEGVSMRPVDPE